MLKLSGQQFGSVFKSKLASSLRLAFRWFKGRYAPAAEVVISLNTAIAGTVPLDVVIAGTVPLDVVIADVILLSTVLRGD